MIWVGALWLSQALCLCRFPTCFLSDIGAWTNVLRVSWASQGPWRAEGAEQSQKYTCSSCIRQPWFPNPKKIILNLWQWDCYSRFLLPFLMGSSEITPRHWQEPLTHWTGPWVTKVLFRGQGWVLPMSAAVTLEQWSECCFLGPGMAGILDVTGLGHPHSRTDPWSEALLWGLFSSPLCWRGSLRDSSLPSLGLTLALPGEGVWNSMPQIPGAAPGSPCTFCWDTGVEEEVLCRSCSFFWDLFVVPPPR